MRQSLDLSMVTLNRSLGLSGWDSIQAKMVHWFQTNINLSVNQMSHSQHALQISPSTSGLILVIDGHIRISMSPSATTKVSLTGVRIVTRAQDSWNWRPSKSCLAVSIWQLQITREPFVSSSWDKIRLLSFPVISCRDLQTSSEYLPSVMPNLTVF